MSAFVPSYIKLFESGELNNRSDLLKEILYKCRLCPRNCGTNRYKTARGKCRSSNLANMVPSLVEGLLEAIPMGLRVPLVYNTGGYDSVDTIAILDGVFDISYCRKTLPAPILFLIYLPEFQKISI